MAESAPPPPPGVPRGGALPPPPPPTGAPGKRWQDAMDTEEDDEADKVSKETMNAGAENATPPSGTAPAKVERRAKEHPWEAFYSAPKDTGTPDRALGAPQAARSPPPRRQEGSTGGASSPCASPGSHHSYDGEARGESRGEPRGEPREARKGDERREHWRDRQVGGRPDDERCSHILGKILRYHTEGYGLKSDEDGFVLVSEFLALSDLQGLTEEDIRRVVGTSVSHRGARFELRERATAPAPADGEDGEDGDEVDAGGLEIRALYKHPKDRPPPGYRRSGSPRGAFSRGMRFYAERINAMYPGGVPSFPMPASPSAHRQRSGTYRGVHGRSGFSQPPFVVPNEDNPAWGCRLDPEEDDMSPAPRAATAEAQSQTSPQRGRGDQSGASNAGASGTRAKEKEGSESGDSGPVSSTTASSTKQEVWERYTEPESQRAWFWNEATEEVFYADDAKSGWERFEDAGGKPWWWHEAEGRFFYEED